MCKVRTHHLLAINGALWTAVGTKIALTGVRFLARWCRHDVHDGHGEHDGPDRTENRP